MLEEEPLVITNGLGHVISKHLMVGYKGSKQAQYLAGDVAVETIEACQERIKSPEDIWNEDETGCFFRKLTEWSLRRIVEEEKG